MLSASQDLLKWAANEENRALQDIANQLAELSLVWTEVQREFCGRLRSLIIKKQPWRERGEGMGVGACSCALLCILLMFSISFSVKMLKDHGHKL